MSAMTNMLIKDDTITTPVEFTFLPVTDNPDPFYRTAVANVPLEGQHRMTINSQKLKNGSYKTSLKLEICVLETLGASGTSAGYVAPPKVAYVTTCIFTMFADKRSTIQNRADALKLAVGALQGASSVTATGVLANTSAGNAFSGSVLPIPRLFTALEVPN